LKHVILPAFRKIVLAEFRHKLDTFRKILEAEKVVGRFNAVAMVTDLREVLAVVMMQRSDLLGGNSLQE
jgi:hypothetical protein